MQKNQTLTRSQHKPEPLPERAWLAQEVIILRTLSSGGETPCSLAARMRRSEQSIMAKLATARSKQ